MKKVFIIMSLVMAMSFTTEGFSKIRIVRRRAKKRRVAKGERKAKRKVVFVKKRKVEIEVPVSLRPIRNKVVFVFDMGRLCKKISKMELKNCQFAGQIRVGMGKAANGIRAHRKLILKHGNNAFNFNRANVRFLRIVIDNAPKGFCLSKLGNIVLYEKTIREEKGEGIRPKKIRAGN